MPGHNGGFNPFRDLNGEYATAERAGKPGRSRSRGGSSGGGYTSPPTSGRPKALRSTAGRQQRGAVPGDYARQVRADNAAGPATGSLPRRHKSAALGVVNAYALGGQQKMKATVTNTALLKRLRTTLRQNGPMMSQEEAEIAQGAIGRLSSKRK